MTEVVEFARQTQKQSLLLFGTLRIRILPMFSINRKFLDGVHELLHRSCDTAIFFDFEIQSVEYKVPFRNEPSDFEFLLNFRMEMMNLPPSCHRLGDHRLPWQEVALCVCQSV